MTEWIRKAIDTAITNSGWGILALIVLFIWTTPCLLFSIWVVYYFSRRRKNNLYKFEFLFPFMTLYLSLILLSYIGALSGHIEGSDMNKDIGLLDLVVMCFFPGTVLVPRLFIAVKDRKHALGIDLLFATLGAFVLAVYLLLGTKPY